MRRIIAVICAIIMVLVGGVIIRNEFNKASEEDSIITEEPKNSNTHHVEYDLNGNNEEKSKLLEHYEAQSPNVIARMYIPGTSMETPIVDSDYYFRRNLEGAYDSSGVPFTTDSSTFNVANKNCVIYGHRLDSGEDFGVLKSYLDQEFYNKHPCIYIETDSGTSEWDIISVFTINISTDSFAYTAYSDMADNSSRGVFLGEVRQRNLIDTMDYTYQTGDRLITLSTCHYETDIDNGRLVVIAVKHR